MKPIYSLAFLLLPLYATAAGGPEVIAEDVPIRDKALEKLLIKALRKDGVITGDRQGVESRMLAVLCEYPKAEDYPGKKAPKPYCLFRKVKTEPRNEEPTFR